MKAKSVRQLLDSAAHVEVWRDGIGWVAYPVRKFYTYNVPNIGRYLSGRTFARYYRIVTVKGKAIA